MAAPNRVSRESETLRAEGARLLAHQIERVATIEQRIADGALEVQEGSTLYYDDQIADYDPPSMQAIGLIGVALDHLATVRALVTGDEAKPGVIPAMAGYTLVRSVVESSAIGIWLRSGGTKDKRVFSSLRHTAKNRRDAQGFAKGQNLDNPQGLQRMTERLEQIRDRTRYRHADLDSFPTLTSMLENIERLVPKGEFTALLGWRAMSGIAHANRTVMYMLLEHEQVGPGDGKGADFRMTSSLYVFAHMVKLGLDCLETLVDLVEKHATTIEPQWHHRAKAK